MIICAVWQISATHAERCRIYYLSIRLPKSSFLLQTSPAIFANALRAREALKNNIKPLEEIC